MLRALIACRCIGAPLCGRVSRRSLQRLPPRFEVSVQQLNALSPLATLERGYAIVTSEAGVVQNAEDVRRGDTIEARLREGRLQAEVTEVVPDE